VEDTDRALVAVLTSAQALGFVGPGAVDSHVEHARAFVEAVAPPRAFLDLGSGGGIPGLVLARAWPLATGALVDSQARRVRFLAAALAELGLDARVHAIHGRAEDLAHDPRHRGAYDIVAARSFGTPAITAECGAGFLVIGGTLVVAEPPDALSRWPADGLASLGLADDGPFTAGGATVRRLRRSGPVPPGVPRRPAAMRRRPAFPVGSTGNVEGQQ
jgi:16S rRNA (guanine527-N7)-methyltransferase